LINTDFEVVSSFEPEATQNLLDIQIYLWLNSFRVFAYLMLVRSNAARGTDQATPNAKCQQLQGVPVSVDNPRAVATDHKVAFQRRRNSVRRCDPCGECPGIDGADVEVHLAGDTFRLAMSGTRIESL